MDFRFTTKEAVRRADEIVEYLRGPRLWVPRKDYPDYDEWLSRAHAQIKREKKRAVLALDSGCVVGVVLYQLHAALPGVLEIKNISVRPELRGRHLAGFMLRNAEVEGRADFGALSVVVDAKSGNLGVRSLLLNAGYLPSSVTDLYGLGSGGDVVYSKALPEGRQRQNFSPRNRRI